MIINPCDFIHLDQRQNGVRRPVVIIDVEKEAEAPEEEPIVVFSKETEKKCAFFIQILILTFF